MTPPGIHQLTPIHRAFMACFEGYTTHRGTFVPSGALSTSGKVEGQSFVAPGGPDDRSWWQHFYGTVGLGVFPILDDNVSVRWGAIDLDVIGIDCSILATRIEEAALPLIVAKSKSGGAHLYCFTVAPVPALAMRAKLQEYVRRLDLSKTQQREIEIFPKQEIRREGEIGSWINMPYFAELLDAPTPRPMYSETGVAMGLEDAVALIEDRRVTVEAFTTATTVTTEQPSRTGSSKTGSPLPVLDDSLFADGPPCLQHYEADGGFPEGSRNDGMLSVAVYLQKKYGTEEWGRQLSRYRDAIAPGLTNLEIAKLEKSIGRHGYGYKCKASPIKEVCQRAECLKQPFGVGHGAAVRDAAKAAAAIHITEVTKWHPGNPWDEVEWEVVVNDVAMRLTHNEWMYVRDFARKYAAQFPEPAPGMTQAIWEKLTKAAGATMREETVPEAASPSGELFAATLDFLNVEVSDQLSETSAGKVVLADGVLIFDPKFLFMFLRQRRSIIPNSRVFAMIEWKGGGIYKHDDTKGLWYLPESLVAAHLPPQPPPEDEGGPF